MQAQDALEIAAPSGTAAQITTTDKYNKLGAPMSEGGKARKPLPTRFSYYGSAVSAESRPLSKNYNGPVRLFVELGEFLRNIAYSKPFERLVMFAIILASIILGLQVKKRPGYIM